MDIGKVNFSIKLIAGNNVVMVEAHGFETELFMPQIINGHINFINIVANRRCCNQDGDSNCLKHNTFNNKEDKANKNDLNTKVCGRCRFQGSKADSGLTNSSTIPSFISTPEIPQSSCLQPKTATKQEFHDVDIDESIARLREGLKLVCPTSTSDTANSTSPEEDSMSGEIDGKWPNKSAVGLKQSLPSFRKQGLSATTSKWRKALATKRLYNRSQPLVFPKNIKPTPLTPMHLPLKGKDTIKIPNEKVTKKRKSLYEMQTNVPSQSHNQPQKEFTMSQRIKYELPNVQKQKPASLSSLDDIPTNHVNQISKIPKSMHKENNQQGICNYPKYSPLTMVAALGVTEYNNNLENTPEPDDSMTTLMVLRAKSNMQQNQRQST